MSYEWFTKHNFFAKVVHFHRVSNLCGSSNVKTKNEGCLLAANDLVLSFPLSFTNEICSTPMKIISFKFSEVIKTHEKTCFLILIKIA